ncbi:hypothetical protein D5S18_25710 [Nocardia panacis]|uniref:Herpesvirus thymidine kinase C-terminal domain-containing protein n=1 Tax=Nocardia panacis TaxID=2340916 RepID=A0A3A4KAK9_9NOCA|nr:hypothetical protein D5S18_25710 [Nocardia panacis]
MGHGSLRQAESPQIPCVWTAVWTQRRRNLAIKPLTCCYSVSGGGHIR